MERCEIPLRLASLNEYINACRTNRFRAAKMKRDTEDSIMIFIRHLPRYEKPIRIHFIWVEPNARRDLDNVSFGKKFILDAMVRAGKLPNDNQQYIRGFSDAFAVRKGEAKIIMQIVEDEE